MTTFLSRAVRLPFATAIAGLLAVLPLSSFSAEAADMPARIGAPVVAAPLWTGFYIGVHGGGGQGSSHLEDPDFQLAFFPQSVRSRGALAGVQIGADWQFGNIVVGGELDAATTSIKGTLAPDPAFLLSGFSVHYQALATATGRAGYAAGNVLGYVKGGVAWANVDFKSALGSVNTFDIDHQRTGLTAGVGVEVLLMGGLSARAEYDYVYFGAAAIALGTRRNPSNVDHDIHLMKLGLNWRFSGDYLTARY